MPIGLSLHVMSDYVRLREGVMGFWMADPKQWNGVGDAAIPLNGMVEGLQQRGWEVFEVARSGAASAVITGTRLRAGTSG